jgi:hypothetical protein
VCSSNRPRSDGYRKVTGYVLAHHLTCHPPNLQTNQCREMEELTFYDAGPKPDWAVKETKPAGFPPPAARQPAGPASFLRPGGPIRSRLVADGTIDEPPPVRPEMGGPGMNRADSWRRSSEGVPIEGSRQSGERWGPGGPPTPVSWDPD